MARKTDIPRVQNPPSGDGHHITSRYMTASELAERDSRQKTYEDMLARQQAYEDRFIRQPQQHDQPSSMGCVFAKSCNLPDGVINHDNPTGFVPVVKLADYGKFSLLGGRERDEAGNIPLKKISGSALPRSFGTLILGGVGAVGSGAAASGAGVVTTGVVAGALAGIVALLWPSTLGDSSLVSLIYHDPSISHDEAISLFDSGLERNIVTALISIGLNEQDSAWAQTICLKHLESGTQSVAAAAITALGHVARRFGELEMQAVMPALDSVKGKFPALEATVADTLDDIEMFT